MSVVIMEKAEAHRPPPVSGGAMDRSVERKRIDSRILIGGRSRRCCCC